MALMGLQLAQETKQKKSNIKARNYFQVSMKQVSGI